MTAAGGGGLHRYRFQSRWSVKCGCDEVFKVLERLALYPAWWPQVKSVESLDPTTAKVRVRSALPYDLNFQMRQAVVDRGRGILQAELSGDLQGWSRWSISPAEGGCSLVFEEEVEVTKPLLRALARVARPFFRLNHRWMMAGGERGLRDFLAGPTTAGPDVK